VVKASSGGLGAGGFTARLSPVTLKASQRVRLSRLIPKGIYKEDIAQLVLPLPRGSDPAADLAGLLASLVPAADLPGPAPASVASAPL
jgi:hypothetical protein